MAARVRKALIAERRTKAIAMRAAGEQWETIARECGYGSRGAACQDVARALAERRAEQDDQADNLRAIEVEHLEALRRRMQAIVDSGDGDEQMKATDRLVKIGERLAKLQGIDAPVKVDQASTVRYEITGVPADAHS